MMRNRTKTPSRQLTRVVMRRNRLALLAAVVVGSGVCGSQGFDVFAANPGTVTRGVLPPLPVEISGPAAEVQNNPFVQPQIQSSDPSIRLASGDTNSAIRLKPIGAPIDLNTIGEDPVRLRPSTIAIDQLPAADVRNNPLVGSAHHQNNSLVELSASDIPSVPQQKVADFQKQVTPTQTTPSVPEFRPPLVVVAPVVESTSSDQFSARVDQYQECALQNDDLVASQIPIQLAADARKDREPIAESQPIYFSISDEADGSVASVAEPILMAEEPAEQLAIPITSETVKIEKAGPVMSDAPADPIQIDEEKLVFNDQAISDAENREVDNGYVGNGKVTPSDSAVAQGMAENAQDLAESTQGLAESTQGLAESAQGLTENAQGLAIAPHAIYRDAQPVVPAPVGTPEPTLVQRRFRPPVAVDSPPIAVTREVSVEPGSMPLQTVQTVEAPQLVLEEINELTEIPGLPNETGVKPSTLYMSRTQVRSLTIGGHVRRIAVGDKNVCQAFAAGPNQLKLIGTGNGVTRLVVWADASDSTPTRVRSFEIRVEDKAAPIGVLDKTTVLNESIRQTFPGSNINVLQQKDYLVAVGQCQSEEIAKQIIRMIRKTCLIPVRDEIQVR